MLREGWSCSDLGDTLDTSSDSRCLKAHYIEREESYGWWLGERWLASQEVFASLAFLLGQLTWNHSSSILLIFSLFDILSNVWVDIAHTKRIAKYIFISMLLQTFQLKISVIAVVPGDCRAACIGHVTLGPNSTGTELVHWTQALTSIRKPMTMWHRLK